MLVYIVRVWTPCKIVVVALYYDGDAATKSREEIPFWARRLLYEIGRDIHHVVCSSQSDGTRLIRTYG